MAERRISAPEPESDRVCQTIVTWHRYAPDVKAELFSTAVITSQGAHLIDPIEIDAARLQTAVAPAAVASVVVSNENHARGAADLARLNCVPVYAHAAAASALNWTSMVELRDGEEFSPGLTAITIEGAPAGEVAIYASLEGGTLVVGDALINMGSHGFALLPAKYCSNQKQMRRSLRKLLAYDFARIVFAHGVPVVTEAKRRLSELLEGQA